jgi:proteasome lid subunit RPN8/RPN11
VIVIPPVVLRQIRDAAEAAYPDECCGLLVGEGDASGTVVVARAVASPNVAQDRRRDRFEVAPEVRYRVMRELGDGPRRIVGHYHSHPDHPARPSDHDLAMAFEPDLIWVIISVEDGRAAATTAHRLDADAGEFREIPLGTPDGEEGAGAGA